MTSSPSPASPQTAEILSGGKRFPLHGATFTELGGGQWRLEFSMDGQDNTMTLIDVIRGGGGSLMLSINNGPVVGAQTRLRPMYQTILSQPMRYDFAWP